MPTRIPASEPTSQKLEELLSQAVADGDARAELLKLAVRKIVESSRENSRTLPSESCASFKVTHRQLA